MRVHDVSPNVRVSREVELRHAVRRNAIDEIESVEAVIEGADEHIVHIEEQPARPKSSVRNSHSVISELLKRT